MAKHEYAKQILAAGFKVVVVEQVERVVETNQRKSEGNSGSGPICVERAPCEVFTSGTLVDPELLQVSYHGYGAQEGAAGGLLAARDLLRKYRTEHPKIFGEGLEQLLTQETWGSWG
eukprot:Skav223680  [mRNA]  locus=scaffold3470:22212:27302:+ [translate_table: standard]